MADPVKRTLEELRSAGAPDFFERDPSVHKARLKAKFEEVSGRTLYPAQTEMFLIEVASYALSLLGEAAQTATLQNTVVFSEGLHLEDRAANVSTYRLLAQRAVTTVEFRLSGLQLVNVVVPKGTRVAAGSIVTFETDKDLVIPAGQIAASVSATADKAGAAWNELAIGAVSAILDPIAYVTSAKNTVAVSGGTDIEDEERFRLRAANALFTISKAGPKNGYREHVMAVSPDIVDVEVVRPTPGKIDIYPLLKNGVPSAQLKLDIAAYLDPETRRPMGDDVTVKSPSAVNFNVVVAVKVRAAWAGMQQELDAAAAQAFYPHTQELGVQVSPSVIHAALMAIPAVIDVAVTGFGYVDLAVTEFPVLQSLAVNITVAANV